MDVVGIRTDRYDEIVAGITREHALTVWSKIVLATERGEKITQDQINDTMRQTNRRKFDRRGVRKIVELFRESGIPICADSGGFWLGTPAEYYESLCWQLRAAVTYLTRVQTGMKLAKRLADEHGTPIVGVQQKIDAIQTVLDL